MTTQARPHNTKCFIVEFTEDSDAEENSIEPSETQIEKACDHWFRGIDWTCTGAEEVIEEEKLPPAVPM